MPDEFIKVKCALKSKEKYPSASKAVYSTALKTIFHCMWQILECCQSTAEYCHSANSKLVGAQHFIKAVYIKGSL